MSIKVASSGCFRAAPRDRHKTSPIPFLLMALACWATLGSLWKVDAQGSTTVEHREERGSI